MIHLLGISSFIGKNFYLLLKKKNENVLCYSHQEINSLNVSDNDIIINFCGINKGNNYDEYEIGNYLILKEIINKIEKKNVFLIHLSSMAVNGFENTKMEDLNINMQYFIKSKLEGENYLLNNYDNNKLLIIRPSNIFGYNCEPYYNNILVSIVYEKINNLNKIKNLNKNCVRNYLSVNGLINKIYDLITNKTNGTYNIISNNNVSLEFICNSIYINKPEHINLNDDEISVSNVNFNNNIIVDENLMEQITILENNMKIYFDLKNNVTIEKLNELVQSRGNMIEISDLNSERLYKITLTKNSIRGNHYHDIQIEDFFVNKGYVYFMLANKNSIDIVYQFKLNQNEKVKIKPEIIHTLINDFINNEPEIFVCSTQKYIKDIVLDTIYINII